MRPPTMSLQPNTGVERGANIQKDIIEATYIPSDLLEAVCTLNDAIWEWLEESNADIENLESPDILNSAQTPPQVSTKEKMNDMNEGTCRSSLTTPKALQQVTQTEVTESPTPSQIEVFNNQPSNIANHPSAPPSSLSQNVLIQRNDLAENENIFVENENIPGESENALVENENILVKSKHFLVKNEDVLVRNNKVFSRNENVFVENKNVFFQNGDIYVRNDDFLDEKKNVFVENENIRVKKENTFVKEENLFVLKKNIFVKNDSVLVKNEDIFVKKKNLFVEKNNVFLENENIFVRNENVLVIDKDVSAENGKTNARNEEDIVKSRKVLVEEQKSQDTILSSEKPKETSQILEIKFPSSSNNSRFPYKRKPWQEQRQEPKIVVPMNLQHRRARESPSTFNTSHFSCNVNSPHFRPPSQPDTRFPPPNWPSTFNSPHSFSNNNNNNNPLFRPSAQPDTRFPPPTWLPTFDPPHFTSNNNNPYSLLSVQPESRFSPSIRPSSARMNNARQTGTTIANRRRVGRRCRNCRSTTHLSDFCPKYIPSTVALMSMVIASNNPTGYQCQDSYCPWKDPTYRGPTHDTRRYPCRDPYCPLKRV